MKGGYPTEGPRCIACNASEADCARMAGCCSMCSHFAHLDEQGNAIGTGRPPKRHRSRGVA